jgi:hypothetical protein
MQSVQPSLEPRRTGRLLLGIPVSRFLTYNLPLVYTAGLLIGIGCSHPCYLRGELAIQNW